MPRRSSTTRALAARVARQGVNGLGLKGSQSSLSAFSAISRPEMTTDTSAAFQALTERAFQAQVVAGLRARGYLVWIVPDMRKTLAGLPDLIFVHPTRVPRRVHFYELKTVTGRVSKVQAQALAALGDVYGVDARVVRPQDWREILEELDR